MVFTIRYDDALSGAGATVMIGDVEARVTNGVINQLSRMFFAQPTLKDRMRDLI